MRLTAVHSIHVYEVRPRTDKRGADLISYVLPFGEVAMRNADEILDTPEARAE